MITLFLLLTQGICLVIRVPLILLVVVRLGSCSFRHVDEVRETQLIAATLLKHGAFKRAGFWIFLLVLLDEILEPILICGHVVLNKLL